jgi:hypothetical protein
MKALERHGSRRGDARGRLVGANWKGQESKLEVLKRWGLYTVGKQESGRWRYVLALVVLSKSLFYILDRILLIKFNRLSFGLIKAFDNSTIWVAILGEYLAK